MKNKLFYITIIPIIFFVFFIFRGQTSAASYDIYVDQSYEDDDSNGSSNKPYRKIGDALEKVDSLGKKIYLKIGTYNENIVLSNGVSLTGENKKNTQIKSSGGIVITSKNDNKLKNITISGGNTGILFKGRGEVNNCIIKNASAKALDFAEKSGTIRIENSDIEKNGKGIYAQKESSFEIKNNNFENNNEEGIDLRERVSGTISGNTIANNGEGGIEVVVGKSNVLINNNEIKKNKASGIAAQFYSQASKIGKIEIKKNYISYNGAYGLVCKAPSGGNPSEGYYNESIELTENKIQNNKSKAISKTCDIVKAVSEEEKKSNEAIESEDSEELPSETIIKTEAEVAQEKFILKEDQLRTVATEIRTNYQASSEVFSEISNSISERGALVKFFIGNDRKKIKNISIEIEKLKNYQTTLKNSLEEIGTPEKYSAALEETSQLLLEIEKTLYQAEELAQDNQKKFSLFGWLINIFSN